MTQSNLYLPYLMEIEKITVEGSGRQDVPVEIPQ